MKSELSRQIFGKNADIKIYENLSRWQPSCSARTGGRLMDGQRKMTKLIVAFRNFANAHKNRHSYCRIGKIIAVYSELHTNHMNALCGQNIGFFLNIILFLHAVTAGL